MSKKKRVSEAQRILKRIGWPIGVDGKKGPKTNEAITDFKRMYAFGVRGLGSKPTLTRRTMRALQHSFDQDGRCSKHFYFREFKSKGNGWIKGERYFVRGLEKLRKRIGAFGVMSGYRDPYHNDVTVGGARYSQHKFGLAIDPSRALPLADVRAVKVFSGIGVRAGTSQVLHVDVRHLGPHNNGGSPTKPVTWSYG